MVAGHPILINGIEEVANRGNLLDRAALINPEAIDQARRRTEADFWSEFDDAHPHLLGALLDAVAGALAALPATKLDRLPRMADFARWGEASSRAEGEPPGSFLEAYEENQALAYEQALESSPAALAVIALMANRTTWKGTAETLLPALEEQVEAGRRRKGLPLSARGLGGALRRAAPGLRNLGIVVEHARETNKNRTRSITITRDQEDDRGAKG
jgi:hypothetical protein